MYLSEQLWLQGEYDASPNRKLHVTIFKDAAPDGTKQLKDQAVRIKGKEVRSGDWVLILLTAAPLICWWDSAV